MNDNKTVGSKNLYKIFLSVVKYLPITLALFQLSGIILNLMGIVLPIITCIGGASILFLLLLWIISYVFRFCYLYRIPLWYVTIITTLVIIDSFIGLPITTLTLFRLHGFIAGSFIIVFIIYTYKNRNNPNIDYISDLCRRYLC